MFNHRALMLNILMLFSLNPIFTMQRQQKSVSDSTCISCYTHENVEKMPCINRHPLHYGICDVCRQEHLKYGMRCWVCRSVLLIEQPPAGPDCIQRLPMPIQIGLALVCGILTIAHTYNRLCNYCL
jgi:hypothetical protein